MSGPRFARISAQYQRDSRGKQLRDAQQLYLLADRGRSILLLSALLSTGALTTVSALSIQAGRPPWDMTRVNYLGPNWSFVGSAQQNHDSVR